MTSDDQKSIRMEEYVRGSASAETVATLEKALRKDAEFREQFLEYLNVDLALSLEAAFTPKKEDAPLPFLRSYRIKSLAITSIAAVLALLLIGTWWFTNHEAPTFATVTNRVGAGELEPGTILGGKKVELSRGILEIKSARGAHIVVEAPAAFQFESEQQLRLFYGKVAANVPESAHGFSVLTSTGKAIDLGTEFGVDVPQDGGDAEIHVFEGEVIAQAQDGNQKNILGGEAFSLNKESGSGRELRSAAFVLPDEFALLHVDGAEQLRSKSDAVLATLRSDPALIRLLDFESEADLPEGQYRMVQGRWPGLRAPEFVEAGDHIKLDVGGNRDLPQLTLAAWIRLDRLGAPYQSLLHTDGWSQTNPGQVHWMVTQNTTMRLALSDNTLTAGSRETQGYPDSVTPVLPDKGRWVHLATVYDSVKKTVRFYINGQFDSESRQDVAHPARLGPSQIGNWDLRDRKLSGRIDELILLGRIMSDTELRELYEAGNPYR